MKVNIAVVRNLLPECLCGIEEIDTEAPALAGRGVGVWQTATEEGISREGDHLAQQL